MTTEADTPADIPAAQDKNLDMVRNILFGEQVRENDKRLATLERFVKVWTNSVRDEMRKHIDELSHEIHLLKDLLNEETSAREGDTRIARQHFEKSSKGIDSLNRQLQSTEAAMERRLQQETERLGRELEQQREALLAQMNQAVEQLRQDKPDRQLLAALLTNMSQQLSGETA